MEICTTADTTLDVAAACGILADWDRRQDVDSRGAQVYNELWAAIEDDITKHFAVPFDPASPVATPRGLTTNNPETQKIVLNGLETALSRLAAANVLPMARWGDIQFTERHGEKIGIPGGDGSAGMYSAIYARLNAERRGYSPIIAGNSYIQVVTWREDGTPDARAVLTYSQSPQKESPWYADQTRLYSNSQWIELPFTEGEINADMVQRLRLTDHRP
ncbi:MAG: penicillin acylase family protein [Gammaproteobacteria bacterium]|nr:penicillin acylase family protein [Gammaproteobacteria bacterium]